MFQYLVDYFIGFTEDQRNYYNIFVISNYFQVMMDVHEPEVRSYNMSRIRSKDTKPEMVIRRFLFKNGFRYRLHVKDLPGKPDLVLPKYKTVIFVNGCFWHGHIDCKHFVLPKTNKEWWSYKILMNKKRDNINGNLLKILGWKTISIWTCQLNKNFRMETLMNLLSNIRKV
jgi:DNA mismatch endonuclease, patch repair protein